MINLDPQSTALGLIDLQCGIGALPLAPYPGPAGVKTSLPLAERYAVVETDRILEFEPLKNATGADSPASVRQRMSDLFAGWLEAAGARVVRRSDGTVPFGIEISPLFALDGAELRSKLPAGLVVEQPLHLR